ncbi:hypothetical protein AGMMS49942_18410 [Spirochaetia bacterium]|nr:hypothetical protein AGMMS49942_18410 [Spirochaetia bacterium]
MTGVFAILPENFFSPLVGGNREHYAALLVLYYRLFQENTQGLERELVIRAFMDYLALHRSSLADEDDEGEGPEDSGEPELDFEDSTPGVNEPDQSAFNSRQKAGQFLRRLINSGWLTDETLGDYTRVVNITPWGKPFFESLARLDEGLKTEYESHVVNIYSALCGDAVNEAGHFAVLHAHEETQALIDSLKVLSQSIKGYYDKLNADVNAAQVQEILHQHYDLYAGEVLDTAYKRLKTSDNVSRYRLKIFKQVGELLRNEEWLNESARKYSRVRATGRTEGRKKLESMLEEIRDDLRAVDPLQDEIDRRNADYSTSSVEQIKALLEPDTTLAGKLGILVKALYGGDPALTEELSHRLHRIRTFAKESLYHRRRREEADFKPTAAAVDTAALEQAEAEFFDRMRRRLGMKRVGAWLDEQGGRDRLLSSRDLVQDEASFIRFVYSLLYADSRPNFDYDVEDFLEEDGSDTVSAGGYAIPDVGFRRKG